MRKLQIWFLIYLIFVAINFGFLFRHLNNPFYADDYWPLAFSRLTENPERGAWNPFFGKSFWRPLPILMDVLCDKKFGLNPLQWHLLDLFLSSFNLLLICYLIYLLLESGKASSLEVSDKSLQHNRILYSLLAVILFASHPISLVPTAWVSCRADLLSTLFGMSSIILLFSGLNSHRLKFLKFLLGVGFSFLAYLSKETAMMLPGFIFLTMIFQPGPKSFLKKLIEAFLILLLSLLVFGFYLWLRYHQTGILIGGYEPIELTTNFLLPRIKFHLPKVLHRAFQDGLFWHLEPGFWYWLLVAGYILLGFVSFIGFRKRVRIIVLGLGWIFLGLVPLWNLSHMLFFREERLLYFGWIGWAIIFAGVWYYARGRFWRIAGLMAWVLIQISFSKAGYFELKNFQKHSQKYQVVREQVFKLIGKDQRKNFARRIYLLGLGIDFYYLDPMFKVYEPDWSERIIVPAERASLAWVKKETALEYEDIKPFLPEVEIHYSDQKAALLTVYPPQDLPQSASQDQQMLILEWDGNKMKNITDEAIRLYWVREKLQENYKTRLGLFPSYEFRKRNYELEWELSPGIELRVPTFLGQFYTFYSQTNDPYLISPSLTFLAMPTAELELRMRIQKRDYLAPQEKEACLFWSSRKDKKEEWKEEYKICFPILADGRFHTYHIPLENNIYWLRSVEIARIRLDPIAFPGWFQLDYLVFSPRTTED